MFLTPFCWLTSNSGFGYGHYLLAWAWSLCPWPLVP